MHVGAEKVIDLEGFLLGSEVPSCPHRFTVLK